MLPENEIIENLKIKCVNRDYRLLKSWIKDVKHNYYNMLENFVIQMNEKINILEKHLCKLHNFEIEIPNFQHDKIELKTILNKFDSINTHLEFMPNSIGYDNAKKSYDEINNNNNND